MQRLYARHRLDIEPSDLAAGLAAMTASDAKRAAADLERLWSPGGQALATYSVRSGFHLLLSTLQLPPGSEVMFSAVTHPDMPRLAMHHGLVPVPVDLDRGRLAPRPDALRRALTARTRILVVAHLFGGLVDLDLAWEMCESRGVLLVEDCAQAFRGPLTPATRSRTSRCSASECSRRRRRSEVLSSRSGTRRCSSECATSRPPGVRSAGRRT